MTLYRPVLQRPISRPATKEKVRITYKNVMGFWKWSRELCYRRSPITLYIYRIVSYHMGGVLLYVAIPTFFRVYTVLIVVNCLIKNIYPTYFRLFCYYLIKRYYLESAASATITSGKVFRPNNCIWSSPMLRLYV